MWKLLCTPRRKRQSKSRDAAESKKMAKTMSSTAQLVPDSRGRYGPFGGRYVPETLVAPLEELERAYAEARRDPAFQAELDYLLHNFAGRPTPLQFASRLTEHLGGARIYIKREDLLHTGAHKINNCLGQGLARRPHGQEARDRGNWRGPAWRCDGDRFRAPRPHLHRLHGH